jgi:hypothetical protein
MDDDTSLRRTAALAALGMLSVGESAVRAAAGPSRAIWRSWPLAPTRAVTEPVLGALVVRGRREEVRVRVALERGVTDRAAAVAADYALLDRVLASPEVEAFIVRVMQSTLVDDLTDQVLASEELQRVVEHVAQSEEVRRALRAQSQGLADEVAGEMRTRSAAADDAAERFARRLLRRRRHRPPGPLETEPG